MSRDRYKMADDERRKAVETCLREMDSAPSARTRIMAVKAFASLDEMNMEQEKRDQGIPDRVEVVTKHIDRREIFVEMGEALNGQQDAKAVITEVMKRRLTNAAKPPEQNGHS